MATRTGRARRPSPTILVVEHAYGSRMLYRDGLSAAGYQVTAVEDGIAALLYLDSHPAPDAVILDLLVSRVPWWVVYEDLRARKTTRATPIVIVGGTEVPQFGPNEYVIVLRTPVDRETLVAAVATVLGDTPSTPTA